MPPTLNVRNNGGFTDISFNQGANLLAVVEVSSADFCSFSVTGVDQQYIQIEFINPSRLVNIYITGPTTSGLADWKVQERYDFNLVALSTSVGGGLTTQPCTAYVNADTELSFTSLASVNIADSSFNITHDITDDVTPDVSVNYSFTTTDSGGADNDKFTIAQTLAGATITKRTWTDAGTQSTFNVQVTGDPSLNHFKSGVTGNSDLGKVHDIVLTIDPSANPIFITSDVSSNSQQAGDQTFDVSDGLTTLDISNSAGYHLFTNKACNFDLSGADAADFTVTPGISDPAGTAAQLNLSNAALYQTKSFYDISVRAHDPSGGEEFINVRVNVRSDTTAPNLTYGSFPVTILSGRADKTAVTTITADEPCFFDVSQNGSAHFEIHPNAWTSGDVRGTTGTITFNAATAFNVDTHQTYQLNARATDDAGNTSSTGTQNVDVSDNVSPNIVISSTSISTSTSNGGTVTHHYTSLQSIPFQFRIGNAATDLSDTYTNASTDQFAVGDITITGGTIADFEQDANDFKIYTANINPTAQTGSTPTDVSLIVPANVFKDDPGNFNDVSTAEFYFRFDAVNVDGFAHASPDISLGVRYSPSDIVNVDVEPVNLGSTITHTIVNVTDSSNPITIDTADANGSTYLDPVADTLGNQYNITYLSSDNSDPSNVVVHSISRTLTVVNNGAPARTVPDISYSGGTVSFDLTADVGWVDDITHINASGSPHSDINETRSTITTVVTDASGSVIPTTGTSVPDIAHIDNLLGFSGTYTVTYTAEDYVYGTITASRNFVVGTGLSFVLSSLAGDFTSSALTVGAADAVTTDTTLDGYNSAMVFMPAAEWNDVFYFGPTNPTNNTSLVVFGDDASLCPINLFQDHDIKYYTVSGSVDVAIPDLSSVVVSDVVLSNAHNTGVISSLTLKRWSKNLLGAEGLESVFSNGDNIKTEINNFMTSGSAVATSLVNSIRSALHQATSMDNTTKTTSNLVRQLVLQLHSAIYGTNQEYRLTSGMRDGYEASTDDLYKGMFHADFADDKMVFSGVSCYPFRFIPGDKFSFKMTIKHANANNFSTVSGSQAAEDVPYKVTLHLTG